MWHFTECVKKGATGLAQLVEIIPVAVMVEHYPPLLARLRRRPVRAMAFATAATTSPEVMIGDSTATMALAPAGGSVRGVPHRTARDAADWTRRRSD
jgi:hypothetical protein